MVKRTILSPSLPSNLIPLPPLSLSLFSHSLSTSLALSGDAYFAADANDLPPLYSDARSVYTFPFIHIQMCSYCLFALGPF